MTGLPAARQTDKTLKGGPITQGSLTVNIGSAGGVACSTCPGGKAVGNPVNPVLGAKVQCWRRFKIEPPCRLNFEPGLMANL